MRNTVTALLSTYVIAVSLVATLAPAVRADLVAYREAIEDMESIVDYFPLDGFLEDTLEGANKLLNNGVSTGAEILFSEDGTDVGGDGQAASFDGTSALTVERSIEESFSILAWIKTDQLGIGSETSQFFQGSGLIFETAEWILVELLVGLGHELRALLVDRRREQLQPYFPQ